jgi:tetratricopeptide (TPR) repeat protein
MRFSEAIPYYDKVISLDPTRFGTWNDRALAKTQTGDYYGAIDDFSEAIKLSNAEDDSAKANVYKNRAVAYAKAGIYQNAVADYSKAIGKTFALRVFLMTVPQIRQMYPELNVISDQDLLEGLRRKYYPNMNRADFVGQYKKNKVPFEDIVLAALYEGRGDAYLRERDFKRASYEYARALHCDSTYVLDRWKVISKSPDSELSVDVQTFSFVEGKPVSLWLKTQNVGSKRYTEENYQIDCSASKMKSVSTVSYDAYGNVMGTTAQQEWEAIVPESIGEVLHDDVCGGK